MPKKKASKKEIKAARKAIKKSIQEVLTDKLVAKALTDKSGMFVEIEAKKSAKKRKGKISKKLGRIVFDAKATTKFRFAAAKVARRASGREPGPGPGH